MNSRMLSGKRSAGFVFPLFLFMIVSFLPAMSLATTGKILFGVTGSSDGFDPDTVTASNFSEYFMNKGTGEPSIEFGSMSAVFIGMMYTGTSTQQTVLARSVIDSNLDGKLNPIDWASPEHPWNRPDNGTPDNPADDPVSWQYTYPQDYPREDLRGTTITMTWDESTESVVGFPEDEFEWWWYELGYDQTSEWWLVPDELTATVWYGRDNDWNMLPNGSYMIQIQVDKNLDNSYSPSEPTSSFIIEIKKPSISGKVVDENGNPIQDANIQINGFLESGGGKTDANGDFTVGGLDAGDEYTITVSAAGKVSNTIEHVTVPTGETEKNVGTITLSDAVGITGTLKLDQNANGIFDETEDLFTPFTNQWGYETDTLEVTIEANNTTGTGWGNSIVQIPSGRSSMEFIIDIPKTESGEYELSFYAQGYAGEPVKVSVNQNGGSAGNVVLTKASLLKGKVKLPNTVTEWLNIDPQAIDVENREVRFWGWGNINPYLNSAHCSDPAYKDGSSCEDAGETWQEDIWESDPTPMDSGSFQFDGLPPGTYDIEIRVDGFKTAVVANVEIKSGEEKDLGEVAIETGSVISGTIRIKGDTTGVIFEESDDGTGPLYIWVDAWNTETGQSGGNSVSVERGIDQSVAYEIGGLEKGRYEIDALVGEGYNLVDENGTAPVFVDLETSATVNLVLKPNEGIVTGILSAAGFSLDLNDVLVEIRRPWDWAPSSIATVENGGIDSQTGQYTLSGLETSDYVVRAGVFQNLAGFDGSYTLLPDPSAAIVTERVFVEDDQTNPTNLDIEFQTGKTVSGTISLSSKNQPWHDFGDGAGGSANGVRDLTNDQYDERISISRDLAGQGVSAFPMDMLLMGGENTSAAPIVGAITDNGDGTGSYKIDGLSPGAYILSPPVTSQAIFNMLLASGTSITDLVTDMYSSMHWAVNQKNVIIGDQDISNVDFTLKNGYTVSGRLTLPESQTMTDPDTEGLDFVGYLRLVSPERTSGTLAKTLFKKDFNNTAAYDFSFRHVSKGDYQLYFYTDKYVPSSIRVSIDNADTQINLNIKKGVDIVGKLVDEETGRAVTSQNGVQVICMADPFVEGSYRETRTEDWAQSYIEDDSDLKQQKGTQGSQSSDRENRNPGKFHLSSLPKGHRYIVFVQANFDPDSRTSKNFISQTIAGIEIPGDASGEIDIGTIKLRNGTTITGRLTDTSGNPVPGVDVTVYPSDENDGENESTGTTDETGFYTIYGIDPEIQYYDLIAAKRPWLFDDWGKMVEWGEERRLNIEPAKIDTQTQRTSGADLVLTRATASISGTITIPDKASFNLPFISEDGSNYPSAYILLQRKGVAYRDMLEGIEGLTEPKPGDQKSARFHIPNIQPGTYKIMFMNYGLPRAVIDNLTISSYEEKIVNATWDDDFFKISGQLALSSGGYPATTDIDGVVCLNMKDRSILFGRLTQEADGTYSAYEVAGLAGNDTYQLIFYKNAGIDNIPEVYAVGSTFSTGPADMDYDAAISRDSEPVLILRALKDPENENKIFIGIFSTKHLSDNRIEIETATEPTSTTTAGQLYLKTGSGTLSGVDFPDGKRSIFTTYEKAAGDSEIQIIACVHYGSEGTTKLQTFSFSVDTVAINSARVIPFVSEKVSLGSGDNTRLFIPGGAMETEGGNNITVSIAKSGNSGSSGKGGTASLPKGVTQVSSVYQFTAVDSKTEKEPAYKVPITVQLQYDPTLVTDTSNIRIYHYSGNSWKTETSGQVIDTENNTISAEVDSLSSFVVGQGVAQSSSSVDTSGIGEGDTGDCFIGSTWPGN